MSFRGRLRLFFTIIVIVPMIAVALVLFALSERSETGKADAELAAGLRTGLSLYRDAADRAEPALRRVARDRRVRAVLADASTGEDPLRGVLRAHPRIVELSVTDPKGALLAELRDTSGGGAGIAFKSARIAVDGRSGRLAVSATEARDFVRELKRISGLEAAVFTGLDMHRHSATLPLRRRSQLGPAGETAKFQLSGQDYRGRVARIRQRGVAPVEIAVVEPSAELEEAISDNRKVIIALLVGFLLLALVSTLFVSRALQEQIQRFLAAARRLARGDFKEPVPAEGRDEFAQLGREFNSMSEQLAAKIDEVERKRAELEETIRRVGDAFAKGLDRQGIVKLAVETAVDACEAEAGRALPLEPGVFPEVNVGPGDGLLEEAFEAAERAAFAVRPDVGLELMERMDPEAAPRQRKASAGRAGECHALAMPMRARLGSRSSAQYAGVISIARPDRPFGQADEELLEYLTAQAVVSIENTDLHQIVQRQAVTDELTGLANVRQLHEVLENEIERARRFESALGLVMLDIDDFKQVNDTYGHQQGDEVLAAVAGVLRDHSRDIDAPARYGGEEMAVALPQTDSDGAAQVAERMREAVEELRVPRVDGAGHLSVTASFGVASLPGSAAGKEALIAAADAALYRAKRTGKNRVEQAEPVAAAG